MLDSIFLEGSTMTLTASNFLLSFAISLALGFVIAGLYMFRSHYSKSFVMTLVMLPGSCTGSDPPGERKPGSWSCSGRYIQPGSLPFRTGNRAGDYEYLPGDGGRTCRRYGISGNRGIVGSCSGSSKHDFDDNLFRRSEKPQRSSDYDS